MTEDELPKCKLAEPGRYFCSHQRTLLSTVSTQSYPVALLQTRGDLPSLCDTGLVRLCNTMWTQLANNSRIRYAANSDVVTILCSGSNHVDVHLKGTGKI
jgi:hypothetical protein